MRRSMGRPHGLPVGVRSFPAASAMARASAGVNASTRCMGARGRRTPAVGSAMIHRRRTA